jgi:hypothetical protein
VLSGIRHAAGFADGRFLGAGNETQQRPNVLPNGTLSTARIASFTASSAPEERPPALRLDNQLPTMRLKIRSPPLPTQVR